MGHIGDFIWPFEDTLLTELTQNNKLLWQIQFLKLISGNMSFIRMKLFWKFHLEFSY